MQLCVVSVKIKRDLKDSKENIVREIRRELEITKKDGGREVLQLWQ